MNKEKQKRISKQMSYVLRHCPESIGIDLTEAGWVDVEHLIAAFAKHGKHISRDAMDEVVANNDKQRFEFSDDGERIRARQGHSVDVALGYEPQEPPEVLYHGTATKTLKAILESGLSKRKRHDVHLSTNRETMLQVGGRHGKPVILAIDSKRMFDDGYEFFVTGNNVWLTEEVPAEYISLDG